MKRWRQYLSSAAATIAVFLMAGLAFAGPGDLPEQASDQAKEVQASKSENVKEAKATETVEAEAEAEGEGENTVNHGHCVSYWAHKSKEDGLSGRDRGQFISSIAQNPDAVSKKVDDDGTADSTCNFQGLLDQAKADAAQASTAGNRGKGKGKGKPESEEGS